MGQISDFMLTLREVDLIMTHSYRDDGVKFTVRSSRKELDASEIVRAALITIGDGGGHTTMAAGFVPNIPSNSAALKIAEIAENRTISYICNIMGWPNAKRKKYKKVI